MKFYKSIMVELELEITDDYDERLLPYLDEGIKKDIARELNCCCHSYEIKNIEITNGLGR